MARQRSLSSQICKVGMLPFRVPDSIEEAIQPVQNPRADESLPARVKELIVMYDTKNCGFLTIDQVGKLLKKLSGFTNTQIDGFCSDIDRSKDGKVSCREFLDWIQKSGGAGGEQVAKAIIRETNKRAVRIKATFDKYDDSGDGSLDLSELKKILQTLGAFTNHEIATVLADMDRSGDGDISFAEFADWVRRATEIKEVIKAKCILAPSDSDGIEAVFYNFCGPGHADIDGAGFRRLARDCKLLNNTLTETGVDLIFSYVRQQQRRIEFDQFEKALELLAKKRGSSQEDVKDAMLHSTHPVLKGSKVEAPGTVPKKAKLRKPKSSRISCPVPKESLGDSCTTKLVDNTNMWKIFGARSEAGRCLKLLYSARGRPSTAIEKRRPSTAIEKGRPITSGAKGRPSTAGAKGRPSSAAKRRSSTSRWSPAMDTWVAVNTLGVCTCGIRLRCSMDLSDICPDPLAVIRWGESIKAALVPWSRWLTDRIKTMTTMIMLMMCVLFRSRRIE